MRQSLALLLGWMSLLGAGLAASAQQPPPTPKEESQEGFRLRVAVEVVNVPLVVRDRNGEFVYDLSRDDITLYDNAVPQQLATFELASRPLSVVILLDTSRRVKPLLERVQKTGYLFVDYVLGQVGEAAVITFDSEVTLRQEFTSEADELVAAIGKIGPGGPETRLADALEQAVALLVERPEGRRRLIIVVSESLDTGSQVSLGVPLRQAQLAGISIYTVGLSMLEAELHRRPEDTPVQRSPYPPGVFPGPGVPGSVQTPGTQATVAAQGNLLNVIIATVRGVRNAAGTDVLELLAQGTGGLNFSARGRVALEDAINLLGQDVHNQYLLSYRPSNRDEHGFHRIDIQVRRRGVRIRTRPGYYVGLPPVEP
ncbi:MAG: VWA domain-containing protein [Terriglobia bacterium]